MDQTLIIVLRYSITYYQKDLFICAQYANKHKATALHKAYWLPCCPFTTKNYHFYLKKVCDSPCANVDMLVTHCFLCVTHTIWVWLTEMSDSTETQRKTENIDHNHFSNIYHWHVCLYGSNSEEQLRASPLKGLWQVPRGWPSSGKGLIGPLHINELGGRAQFALRHSMLL